MKKYFSIVILLLLQNFAFSQGEIDDEHKIMFRNEKSFGMSLNSNGIGFGYRFAKRKKPRIKRIYEGNFNTMKHSKETKQYSWRSTSLSRFVFGKTHSVFNLRFGLGRQKEIFKKLDKNSVSIRFFYIAGITTAFAKPIYYLVYNDKSKLVSEQKYDSLVQVHLIVEQSSYFKGIDEMLIIPGAYLKTGFSFNFSKTDKKLSMLEVGVSIEAYPKPIEIMALQPKQIIFPTVFLSFRFGKVISDYYLKELDEGTDKNIKK